MTNQIEVSMEEQNDELNFGEQMKIAKLLTQAMNAEQLRRFSHHHDVPRTRGDNKMQTAFKVVNENPEAANFVELSGDYVVYCGHCGTRGGQRFETSSEEISMTEAREHKAKNPSHFPIVLDISEEDDVEKLYG